MSERRNICKNMILLRYSNMKMGQLLKFSVFFFSCPWNWPLIGISYVPFRGILPTIKGLFGTGFHKTHIIYSAFGLGIAHSLASGQLVTASPSKQEQLLPSPKLLAHLKISRLATFCTWSVSRNPINSKRNAQEQKTLMIIINSSVQIVKTSTTRSTCPILNLKH